MREALEVARAQLILLGGDGSGEFGDAVQRKVIEVIDEALRGSGERK